MRRTAPTTRGLLRTLTAVVGISSLPAATSAADTERTPIFLNAVGNEGPRQEPRAQFDTYLANYPNVTGHYAIPGPNISASTQSSSSGNESTIDGWQWSITVAADLPLENSSSVPDDDGKGPFYYTGGKIVLTAPSSLVGDGGNLTVQDDWKACLYRWDLRNVSYPEELRSDNGTCGSVLSDECIADMKAAAAPTAADTCVCPRMSTIPSCSGLGDASKVFDTSCAGAFYNASRLRGQEAMGWEDGKLETYTFGDATSHHRGNTTTYDDIASLAWPVMASFGNVGYNVASLTCVRATDTNAGSTAPNYDLSSGNSLGSSLAGMGVAILVCMLLL
ncbi:hypothetical protein F5Y12DRAFT_374626 [Xylaria sp. FL1777]|nr:hypothetical protein F5Y12DRAFT_374626 [Xylaria sp. FL1777]